MGQIGFPWMGRNKKLEHWPYVDSQRGSWWWMLKKVREVSCMLTSCAEISSPLSWWKRVSWKLSVGYTLGRRCEPSQRRTLRPPHVRVWCILIDPTCPKRAREIGFIEKISKGNQKIGTDLETIMLERLLMWMFMVPSGSPSSIGLLCIHLFSTCHWYMYTHDTALSAA